MTHNEILKIFKKKFPLYSNIVYVCQINSNSVKIKIKDNKNILVFTIFNDNNWILETFDSYKKKNKRGKKC